MAARMKHNATTTAIAQSGPHAGRDVIGRRWRAIMLAGMLASTFGSSLGSTLSGTLGSTAAPKSAQSIQSVQSAQSTQTNQNGPRSGACGTPLAQGVLRLQPVQHFALSDGVIGSSPYAAGANIPAGQVLLNQTQIEQDNRQTDVKERIAHLKLKLLDARNQALVNQAGLADFVARNGPLDNLAQLRVRRQDEIRLLEAAIAELEKNGAQQKLGRQVRLPYPVLLLTDPPRVAETVKAGTALFQYVYLDRITLAVYGEQPNAAPALYLPLGQSCLKLALLRGIAEPKNHGVQWLYQANIDPARQAEVARLIRAPQAHVPLFGPPPVAAGSATIRSAVAAGR